MEARKVTQGSGAWVATAVVGLGALVAVVAEPKRSAQVPESPRFVAVPEEVVPGNRNAVTGAEEAQRQASTQESWSEPADGDLAGSR